MDPELEAHRRHLAALRDACSHRPSAHSHQLAALDRLIALAGEHDDLLAFRRGSGDGFELTRAITLDRVAGQARVAALIGDPLIGEAAALEYRELLEARGHEDWPACVGSASARAAPLRERATSAADQLTRLALALLGIKSAAGPADAAVWQEHAQVAYTALLEADPGFGSADFDAIPRYALRIPWTGPGRALVAGWLPPGAGRGDGALRAAERELSTAQARWRDGLAHLPTVEVSLQERSVEAVLAPYRALAESLTGTDRRSTAVREAALAAVRDARGAANGSEAAAQLAAGGRLADLTAAPQRARAEAALERQAIWPDPLVAHHWRALLAALEGVRTSTEAELVIAHAEACFAIERDWNSLVLETLLGPLRAAFAGAVGPSAALTEQLTGLGGGRLLELSRVRGYLHQVLEPLAARPPRALGAFEGEAGFDVVVAARGHLEEGGDPDLRAVLGERLGESGGAVAAPFALWREEIDPGDLAKALTQPSRPRL